MENVRKRHKERNKSLELVNPDLQPWLAVDDAEWTVGTRGYLSGQVHMFVDPLFSLYSPTASR